MIGAVPFNLIFGGGETQLINTMESLKKMEVDVGYYDFYDKNYKCDIVHIFGCHHWLYHWAELAKGKGMKIALSTISYAPIKKDIKRRIYDFVNKILPVDTTYSLSRKLITISDILLPNSKTEIDYLNEIMGVKNKISEVIPNATDICFKNAKSNEFIEKYNLNNFVLCVGKFEPRKNQLLLVKALENTNIPLALIGSFIPNNKNYYDEVIKIVNRNKNMVHIEYLPYNSNLLASAYAASKVHVLLGRNETPGIVNLEAGLAGANLVVGDCLPVREYLKDYAYYCNLNSISDIKEKIIKAYEADKNTMLSEHIEAHFTWDKVAEKTLAAYKLILN